jgi:DNA repair exonuclease SbcCD ATPase subunit
MAKKAVVLRRQIDRAESYARNYAWQAGQIRNQYNNIAKALGSVGQKDAGPEYLLGQFRALAEQKDETERKIEESKHSLKDAELRLSELSVTASILRNQYSRLFSDHISARTNVASHPIVTSSISEGRCNLCGASGPEVVNTIRSRAAGNKCPLCDSQLIQNMADGIDELMEVDSRILQTRTQIDETLRAIERVKDELRGREDSLKKTLSKLDDFEAKNQDLLQISKKMDLSDAQATLLRYRKQMEELQLKRDEEYGKRDEAKLELHKVRSELGRRYAEAEEEFVPLFRNLSNLFLGIDLDVRMESGSQGLNLVLDVKSTPRRQHHQLSESQRFFVDIALRMALSQYISDEQSKACLVIDTPEGSLDIAYESRAGGMLAEYALSGYQVIMTANINTSQLLIRLAAKCGHGGMKLVRMTPWVELSDVQIAEEGLFEEAFEKIEAALG